MSGIQHYVIGDVHGDVRRLKALEKKAGMDVKKDCVILLGDLRII